MNHDEVISPKTSWTYSVGTSSRQGLLSQGAWGVLPATRPRRCPFNQAIMPYRRIFISSMTDQGPEPIGNTSGVSCLLQVRSVVRRAGRAMLRRAACQGIGRAAGASPCSKGVRRLHPLLVVAGPPEGSSSCASATPARAAGRHQQLAWHLLLPAQGGASRMLTRGLSTTASGTSGTASEEPPPPPLDPTVSSPSRVNQAACSSISEPLCCWSMGADRAQKRKWCADRLTS